MTHSVQVQTMTFLTDRPNSTTDTPRQEFLISWTIDTRKMTAHTFNESFLSFHLKVDYQYEQRSFQGMRRIKMWEIRKHVWDVWFSDHSKQEHSKDFWKWWCLNQQSTQNWIPNTISTYLGLVFATRSRLSCRCLLSKWSMNSFATSCNWESPIHKNFCRYALLFLIKGWGFVNNIFVFNTQQNNDL